MGNEERRLGEVSGAPVVGLRLAVSAALTDGFNKDASVVCRQAC
jgi:hypothetical protein